MIRVYGCKLFVIYGVIAILFVVAGRVLLDMPIPTLIALTCLPVIVRTMVASRYFLVYIPRQIHLAERAKQSPESQ